MTSNNKIPYVLIILDGWGHGKQEPDNAISSGHTPNWDNLWSHSPHCLISGSGKDVGLPEGQMGNSEVGHMTLGAGRIIKQDFSRITDSIRDNSFYNNPVLSKSLDNTIAAGTSLHIFGLLSPGGVHSHENHMLAMVRFALKKGVGNVYVHAFLDGRDTPPQSAMSSLRHMESAFTDSDRGGIASISGRFYAMDRDNRWDRTQQAYDLLTGHAVRYISDSSIQALEEAYARGETDEFVQPTSVKINSAPVFINDQDSIIFMNFRADRARQLTKAFIENDFVGFKRNRQPGIGSFVSLTRYSADFDCPAAYEPLDLSNSLGEYLETMNKTQLRIAETEKYAHVTFFFSCGNEDAFQGEERILIPSPKVRTYDLMPEMSAPEVTDNLVNAILSRKFDLIVCNYANGDMVGHTGNLQAAIKAVECLDTCLGRVMEAVKSVSGHCLITADHGNVEKMKDMESNQPHTAHTSELVPLVYWGDRKITFQKKGGTLADVSPTILELMNICKPHEMTGKSLIQSQEILDETG